MSKAMKKLSPTYLNTNYIKKALETVHGSSATIAVTQLEIKLANECGENFCSDIYRVHVKYECTDRNNSPNIVEVQEKSLIVKDMIMEIEGLVTNECLMYERILPKMEQILRGGDIEKFHLKPNCLMCDRDDKELYVLDDLNALGYRIGNRWTGLDVEHTMKLLAKLAQFHAASMIYVKKFPEEAAQLKTSNFAKGPADNIVTTIINSSMQYVIKVVEQWDDFAEIAEKMKNLLERFHGEIKKCFNLDNTKVMVINHGDLWVNNFFYHYDGTNQPNDVLFVDFQNCHIASAGLDLNYFLYTSVQLDVLKTKRYDLLRFYYKTLKETLRRCGATTIPTWQTIVDEMHNCEMFGYYAAVSELPICCMSREISEGFTQKTFLNPSALAEKHVRMYAIDRVQETLRYVLDRLNELRLL